MIDTMPISARVEKARMSCTAVMIDRHGLFRLGEQTYEVKIYQANYIARIWTMTGKKDIHAVSIDGIRVPFRKLGEDKWRMPE